jgi:hypothetical protein
MTNAQMPNDETTLGHPGICFVIQTFVIRHSFGFRASGFVIYQGSPGFIPFARNSAFTI